MEDPAEDLTWLEDLVLPEDKESFKADYLLSADRGCDFSENIRRLLVATSETSSRGLSLLSSQSPESHSIEASTNLTEEAIGQEGEVYNNEYQASSRVRNGSSESSAAKSGSDRVCHPQEPQRLTNSKKQGKAKRCAKEPSMRLSKDLKKQSKKQQVFQAFYRLYKQKKCAADAELTLKEVRSDETIAKHLDDGRSLIPSSLREMGFLVQPKKRSGVYLMGVKGIEAATMLGW